MANVCVYTGFSFQLYRVFRTISQYYRSYKSKLLKLVLVPKNYLKEIYLKERYPQ